MSSDDVLSTISIVNLYAVAVDSHRYDLFDRIFTPDVKIDFGGGYGWTGLDPLKTSFEAIHAPFFSTQHIVSGHNVTVERDEAFCLSYVHARFQREVDGKRRLFDSTGWYDDKLIRTSAGWRIKERVSRMVSTIGDTRVMLPTAEADTPFDVLALAAERKADRVSFFAAIDRISGAGTTRG